MSRLDGLLLAAATLIALALANSPLADRYIGFWQLSVLHMNLLHWVNDGLMAIYFFALGLGIKREFAWGQMTSMRAAALPVLTAAGAGLVPATLYWLLNPSGPGQPGWGIPMATDAAFVLGFLALLGDRVSHSLKVFLTAVAIVDDMMAVLIIAIFYGTRLDTQALGGGIVCLVTLACLALFRVRNAAPYIVLGAVIWWAFLHSGVHATVAGVLIAMLLPVGPQEDRREQSLVTACGLFIVPVFALANCGIRLDLSAPDPSTWGVMMGIAVGLCLGKPLGLLATVALAVNFKWADLPQGMNWPQMVGVGVLAGLGFTISLFIATLAFTSGDLLNSAKMAILGSSLLAGVVGLGVLHFTLPARGN